MSKRDILANGRRRYMSLAEVAEYLGMGRTTVYEEVMRGNLKAKRFGQKNLKVHVDELRRYEDAADYEPTWTLSG